MIVMGATCSRDWQPIHHNEQWAREQAGLPNIIMNNYTQAGLISRFVTDWCGVAGRIARIRFRMHSPICPDTALHIQGQVTAVDEDNGDRLVHIAISFLADGATLSTAQVTVAVPKQTAK
jgi:acyl dehydratase